MRGMRDFGQAPINASADSARAFAPPPNTGAPEHNILYVPFFCFVIKELLFS